MTVTAFDHVAVPSARPREMMLFYRALGFGTPDPDAWAAQDPIVFAVTFGNNKINFHAPRLWQDAGFTLRGSNAPVGCGDFCFVWSGSIESLQAALARAGAEVELGPVERVGGRNGGRDKGTSLYTRDPDRNLLEFIVY